MLHPPQGVELAEPDDSVAGWMDELPLQQQCVAAHPVDPLIEIIFFLHSQRR